MEGKKRDRPLYFNQVFNQQIDDYKNNTDKPDLTFNVLKAFKQLEAAEVDPSLLAHSIILNKDPDSYQPNTPHMPRVFRVSLNRFYQLLCRGASRKFLKSNRPNSLMKLSSCWW